jgi:predicted DNA-binding transcriptional regulator AlpA
MDEKHLSPEQLAEREGVALGTVYTWNKSASGPPYLRVGRHVRYRLVDVLAWEESRLVYSSDQWAAMPRPRSRHAEELDITERS